MNVPEFNSPEAGGYPQQMPNEPVQDYLPRLSEATDSTVDANYANAMAQAKDNLSAETLLPILLYALGRGKFAAASRGHFTPMPAVMPVGSQQGPKDGSGPVGRALRGLLEQGL